MKQLGKNILRHVFGVLVFTFIFCAQNINAEAAETINEKTTTTGSATYDPNNGSNTQDFYDFAYKIGDTSKTTANDSNVATITNYHICNNAGNCTIPASVKVKYNSKTYVLKVTEVGNGSDQVCSPSGVITVGNNVTKINNYAFYNARYATSIKIGSKVTSIGTNSFQNCSNATSVSISNSVASIGNYAFDGCTSLKTITFASGSKCTSIGSYAFYGCTSLANIRNTNANYTCTVKGCSPTSTTVHSKANCTGSISDHRYLMPASITTIGDYAFYNCSALSALRLNTGVTTLGYNTFRGTTPLTTLTINSNISGHNNAFKGHTGLTTLKIGSSLTNIYANMFQECPNLSKVDISGSNVTSIGAYAFEGCKKLNTKNAFDYAAFDASLSGTVGEYAFRFGGFTEGASAGLPSVSVSQSVVEDKNYFPTSGGIGKVNMNINTSPATANEGKDYIVILDTTGSMDSKVNGVTKMTTAKNALQKFADTVMEENAENRIAIVHFRGDVDTDGDGTADASGGYCYLDFTKDKSTISTKITNLKSNAGGARIATVSGSHTNYRLGIIAALNVMQMRGAESSLTAGGVTYGASGGADRNTYVVFISDGAANQQTSYITPLSKILKAAADEIWSIGICVEDSGETTEYLKMINTTMCGQDLFIDFPSADLEAAMTDFLKQVVSMSTSSIYNTVLTSVIQSNWTPYKDSSHVWSSGVTNSGQNVSVNIGAMGKESKSYTFYVKLTDAYKKNTMATGGTYNPVVTNNVHADYKVSGGKYEGQSKTASNTQQYTLPWYAYDVIYNGNGNTGGSTSNQVKIGGINLSLRSNGFTKTAYRFKEWNTKADGTGIAYTAGFNYSTNEGLTLYAIWEPDTAKYSVNHYAQNADGSYTLVETEEFEDTIGKTVTPDTHPQTGRNTPPKQSVVIAADGSTVVNYYYDVTRFDVNGTVSWNDHENKYHTRPDDITVRLYLDGKEINNISVSAANTSNKYSFTSLQKYDLETGRELVYAVSQDTAYSQAALVTPEDKYETKQNGYDFLNTIRNTEKPPTPGPDEPEDKGLYIEGNIYWEDNGDSLGFRPPDVTITLYQKGEDGEWKVYDNVVVPADPGNKGIPGANHYIFDWLPKYWYDENDMPTKYEYKVEETFTSWYVEDGEIKDAYTIYPDTPNNCDFTNVFNKPEKPTITVNEYMNTLIIKTNTDEKISVILKPLELFINDDYSVSYGDKTGNDIPVFTDKTGDTITKIPSTRYEIVIDTLGYTIDDMALKLEENMKLEQIDGKWYITIENVPDDAIGTLEITISKKTDYYQTSQKRNNYFAAFTQKVMKAMSINMMSDFIILHEESYTIQYMDSQTIDETEYHIGETAVILGYEAPLEAISEEIMDGVDESMAEPIKGTEKGLEEFLGWTDTEGSTEVLYLPGDEIAVEDSLILYPVFELEEDESETESSEDSEAPEESEEINDSSVAAEEDSNIKINDSNKIISTEKSSMTVNK